MLLARQSRACRPGARKANARPVLQAPRALPAHITPAGASQVGVVEDMRHVTVDGQGLELLLARAGPDTPPTRPPLLFIHGSYHAAWCWKEHFLPYFAKRGFNAYALSLRAQGNSDPIQGQLVAGTLDTHAQDVADLVDMFPVAPVVVGHSFGGLILQKYMLKMNKEVGQPGEDYPRITGAAFLNCVPPSGNKKMIGRFFMKDIMLSMRVTWGFISKSFVTDPKACRELFFSPDLPEADLKRYQAELAKCSEVRLMDLQDVNKQVPLPPPPANHPPTFVLGGEDDVVVDVEAVKETAAYYGVKPVVLPRVAHDSMLDPRWETVAAALEKWLLEIKV